MGTSKAIIICAISDKNLYHDLPVYMQKIGGISVLSHIINHCNDGDIIEKIAVAMHEDCYEKYKEQLEKEIVNLNHRIYFETFTDYEIFSYFFQNTMENLQCDELLLMNASLPFINNALLQEIFTILNNPIGKSEEYLPAAVIPRATELKINAFLDDLEKSINIIKNCKKESINLSIQTRFIAMHSGFLSNSIKYMHSLLQQQWKSMSKKRYIDFVNNNYLMHLFIHIIDNNLHIAHLKISEKNVFELMNKDDLMTAELIFQERTRQYMIEKGVHMIDSSTVFFSANVVISKDVTIYPHVVFGCNVIVEKGVVIKPYSYLENTKVDENSIIGPFANLYNNVKIGKKNLIGNFTNIASSVVENNNHIQASNLCKTVLGNNNIIISTSFVNSDDNNFSLINNDCNLQHCIIDADVHIGENTNIASGNMISKNIPENSSLYYKEKHYIKKKKKKEKILETEEI